VRIAGEGSTDFTARVTNSDRLGGKPPTAPSSSGRWKPPRNAAVAIKASAEGLTYAEIIKQAREKVNLKDLGIINPRMRRTANGGVIIEILGPKGASKADILAS